MTVRMLFDTPQRAIADTLRARLEDCTRARIVVGFATVEGVEIVLGGLRRHPERLETLVVGAATFRAFDALDTLIAAGVAADALHVHLGFSRPTGATARYRFYRYHPMLHSKVYLMELPEDRFCAFVGSHNLTGFALSGLNGEASVFIEGSRGDPVFADLNAHVAASQAQAVSYDTSLKEAYSWWTTQAFEGLRDKSRDIPRDAEPKRTIVVMAASARDTPREGEIIYFEIPEALGTIQSLRADVHIYLFDTMPRTPGEALNELSRARASLWCRTEGLEMGRGGVELRAHWAIQNRRNPELRRTSDPFRPTPSPGMQQVRVQVRGSVFGRFDYLFDSEKPNWAPIFDEEQTVVAPEAERETMARLRLIPPEDNVWLRVKGFERGEPTGSSDYRAALSQSSPESGSFILMSLRRRDRA